MRLKYQDPAEISAEAMTNFRIRSLVSAGVASLPNERSRRIIQAEQLLFDEQKSAASLQTSAERSSCSSVHSLKQCWCRCVPGWDSSTLQSYLCSSNKANKSTYKTEEPWFVKGERLCGGSRPICWCNPVD